MTKSYLLFKCGATSRTPLVVFSADHVDEAREAPTWLKRKHPDMAGLHLEPGEFFEIIEKEVCDPKEWEAAVAAIAAPTLAD
ncbi:hypothetical protein [Desulfovibrio sp. DV]|uniref:hypothetical protein n=1 Tax=Desulfovibrio sp. DV TaxID=1844708 RepID=UPI00094BB2AB|nr:hypothetical protein [Desulfovibrio sp. DV]